MGEKIPLNKYPQEKKKNTHTQKNKQQTKQKQTNKQNAEIHVQIDTDIVCCSALLQCILACFYFTYYRKLKSNAVLIGFNIQHIIKMCVEILIKIKSISELHFFYKPFKFCSVSSKAPI